MTLQAAGMLKTYLEQRQTAGQTHVGLRPGTLERLCSFKGATTARAQEVRRKVEASPRDSTRPPAPVAGIFEAPAVISPRARAGARLIEVTGATKAEQLAALAAIAEASTEARALGSLRDTMVFAVGNADAQIMLIGEAPGFEEERQREPFVGPAGQKLTGILKAMGLERSDVYISNICKFRPALEDGQGTANRAPSDAEMASCLPYVMTEISIIQPQVIVALGGIACKGLGIGEGVMRLRGRFYDVQGIPTMVTYHPRDILREEKLAGGGIRTKLECWQDMLKVMEKAGLPISEKQRGFFKK
jgi:uracil-DNA glycosylase family 4